MDINYESEIRVIVNDVEHDIYSDLEDFLHECGYFLNLDMQNIDRLNFEVAVQFGTDDLMPETMELIGSIKAYPLTHDAKRISIFR